MRQQHVHFTQDSFLDRETNILLETLDHQGSQQSSVTPADSVAPQDRFFLVHRSGLCPPIPIPQNIEPEETCESLDSIPFLIRLLNGFRDMSLQDLLDYNRPFASSESDDTETDSEQAPESADPPPYPNFTHYEWLVAMLLHRRDEGLEGSSEECECGECHHVPPGSSSESERPSASADHKYKAPPPYSAPADVERPEAHQFRALPG